MQHHSPWQAAFYRALSAHEALPTSRYLQLATVDNHGHPHCRTLVFRGFNQDKNQLYLHTDNRSEKMSQLEIHNHVEACWYFSETREQFRFSAQVERIGHEKSLSDKKSLSGKKSLSHVKSVDQSEHSKTASSTSETQRLRLEHWQNLSDALRESYGQNYDLAQPDENFVLLILHITKVDYLRLAPLPHLRVIYHLDASKNWQAEAAIP